MTSAEQNVLRPTDTTVQSSTSSISSMYHHATLGTLGIAWLLFAMSTAMALRQVCESRRRQRKKMATVRSYLTRFKQNDVKVYNSPPGGFNVLYNRRRLVNRLKYYWTGELPDPEDASTIVFESDVEEQPAEQEKIRRQSQWSEDSWPWEVSSCTSSSHSSSSSSASSKATPPLNHRRNKSNTNTRRRWRVQNNIISVLQSSDFSLADVRLENSSLSEDGFSVTFRGEGDEDSEEVIDFCIRTDKAAWSQVSCFPELDLIHGEANSDSIGDEAGEGHTEGGCDEDGDFY